MTRQPLAPDEAHAIWDLLIAKAGAAQWSRGDFVRYVTATDASPHEYRFCGLLGTGGKFYFDGHGTPYVDCYREDRDEVRDAICAAVNAELAHIVPPVHPCPPLGGSGQTHGRVHAARECAAKRTKETDA